MFFLFFNNVNIVFIDYKQILRFYTTTKVLPTIQHIKIIDKKEFSKEVLIKNIKTFLVHIICLSPELIYLI